MENRPARSVKTVRSGPLPVVACASTATPGRTKPVVSVTVPDTAPSLGAGACGRESGRDDCERDAPPGRTSTVCPLLTSAPRSGHLTTPSVPYTGQDADLGDRGLGHAQLKEVPDFILLAVEP